MGVFLWDSNPYLREFQRKSRKTQNGKVDKRDRESKPAPPAYQFWEQSHSATSVEQESFEGVPSAYWEKIFANYN